MQVDFAVEFGKLVVSRDDDLSVPVITRHEQQLAEEIARAGRDREIDLVGRNHVGNLFGRTLVQVEVDPGVAFAEIADDFRQHVARLRMGRGNRQRAFFLVVVIRCQAANVFDLLHDQPCTFDHLATRRGYSAEAFALAYEKLQPELFLEQLELLAYPRLRCVKPFGRRCYIQSIIDDRQQIL